MLNKMIYGWSDGHLKAPKLQFEPAGTETAYTGTKRKVVELSFDGNGNDGVVCKGKFYLDEMLNLINEVVKDESYPEYSCPYPPKE